MINTKKISDYVSLWVMRIEFTNRIWSVPQIIVGRIMLFAVFCKTFKISEVFIKYFLIFGGISFVISAWILDRTKLKEKIELESSKRAGNWKKLWEEIENIKQERQK